MERNQRVSICRNTFRLLIGQKQQDKYQRYCPSIEGSMAAFCHSSDNLKKLLSAGFATYQALKQDRQLHFTEVHFRTFFPNNPEITENKWRHAYKALRETLRSFNFNPDTDWITYLPFLLGYAGAYQGWVDPDFAIPDSLFEECGRQDQTNLSFVKDLYDQRFIADRPIIPAANMRTNLNGLNTPSTEGGVGVIPSMESSGGTNSTWTYQQQLDATQAPSSVRPAPVFGELNNVSPPMFIDFDPNIPSAFDAVIYIQAEVRNVTQLLRHKDARQTRYDERNDPAWHRRADQSEYQIMNIVKFTDVAQFPVKTLDELNLVDDKHQIITQDYLDTMMDYLNGRKFIPNSDLSARNTFGHTIRAQKDITKDINKEWECKS